jgi:hypothetical protein
MRSERDPLQSPVRSAWATAPATELRCALRTASRPPTTARHSQ